MWDIKTPTAADFTVEIIISENQWIQYNIEKARYALLPTGACSPDHADGGSSSAMFSAYLEHTIINQLNSVPKVLESGPI